MKAWIAVLALIVASVGAEAATYRERGLPLVDSATGSGGCRDRKVMYVGAKTEKGEMLKKLDMALDKEYALKARLRQHARLRQEIEALGDPQKPKTLNILGLKIGYMGLDKEAKQRQLEARAQAEDEFAMSVKAQELEIEDILAEVDAAAAKFGLPKREARNLEKYHKSLIESGAVAEGLDFVAEEVVYEQTLACSSHKTLPLLY